MPTIQEVNGASSTIETSLGIKLGEIQPLMSACIK